MILKSVLSEISLIKTFQLQGEILFYLYVLETVRLSEIRYILL